MTTEARFHKIHPWSHSVPMFCEIWRVLSVQKSRQKLAPWHGYVRTLYECHSYFWDQCYDHHLQLFSAKKIAFVFKTNVMIKFLHELHSGVLSQKRLFCRQTFVENIFKIITSVPGRCLLFTDFHKSVRQNWLFTYIPNRIFPEIQLVRTYVRFG
jgi:hypothetical protein